ncbi:putative pentatricopeptide repeat-containing protein, mitochondrial [Iris pallida]|uniref:Pentatricopeptide repeat-containing protein, mitochondrial n=1 Tax=Iris pallida TaxID=29817 RepID=A0AAX6FKE3_IRIPA|nr:putative pentatricopeptide repeat-containing protein, mitochondrial [Iris pallida]
MEIRLPVHRVQDLPPVPVTNLLWKAGARVGCSISARTSTSHYMMEAAERSENVKRTPVALLHPGTQCVQFAEDKCLPPFRDARIGFNWKEKLLDGLARWHHHVVMVNGEPGH